MFLYKPERLKPLLSHTCFLLFVFCSNVVVSQCILIRLLLIRTIKTIHDDQDRFIICVCLNDRL